MRPSYRMWLFLALWSALWHVCLPLILAYLWLRARKDPLYRAHLGERFGFYRSSALKGAVWVHAVSLGEFRSAVPLIRGFLARGEAVVVTCFTPAGRREAEAVFGTEPRVTVVWVPLETSWAYRRFFKRFAPKLGLVMEIEIWPRMVFAARAAGVPLFMCNAQYPSKAVARDSKGLRLRQEVMAGFAGAFVKSSLQEARFAQVGVQNIAVTGELRFEQAVPPALVAAGLALKAQLGARKVVAFVSTVEGEEATFLPTLAALRAEPDPFIVYVPRRPERFESVAEALKAQGIALKRRSQCLDASLAPLGKGLEGADLLFGDSLGEMYFYLALADAVVVGGGFSPKGAHNIIEPLALGKPVFTGPETFTIEYPFTEAAQAGVAQALPDAQALVAALRHSLAGEGAQGQAAAFFAEHSGGVARFFAALPEVLAKAR